MGRVLLTVVGASALCIAVAWSLGLLPGSSQDSIGKQTDGEDSPGKKQADVGEPLYAPAKVRPIGQQTVRVKGNTMVLAAQLNTPVQSEHGSQVEGQISFIGEELPEWLPAVTGVAPLMVDPMNFRRFTIAKLKPRTSETSESSTTGEGDVVEYELIKFYRRLKETSKIREDQMLVLIEPTLALSEVERQRSKVMITIAEAVAADRTLGEARQRLEIARTLFAKRPPAIAAEDYRLAELTYAKSLQDLVVKQEGIRAARMEEKQAQLKLAQHTVRSKLVGPYGSIKKILRHPGDSVKAQEPILQIVSLDPLEAEALVEVQQATRLQPGRRVIVEPTDEIPPTFTFKAHTLEVTSVAVSNQPTSPLILSGSEDRTVCVWAPGLEAPIAVLAHPAPVRSIVCSPHGAKLNFCLVGCDDGSIHLWNLSPNGSLIEPVRSISGDEGHKDSSVTALAFSPDGAWFASGGSDSRILVWDLNRAASKEKDTSKDKVYEYAVEQENGDNPHEGTITSLSLLPQAKLVSAARDKTLRVWSLHQKGARLAYAPLADRSGLVTQIGASQDGRLLLFDPQKGGLQVRSVEDKGRIVKTLENPPGTIPFETLAQFSPDASLLLTAGAPEGRLQLWKAPTENSRGFEVRQLTTVERQSVTCAAFGQPGSGFAVTGTRDGNVYYWTLPTQSEIDNHRIEDARISVVAQVLDQTRQVPIRIELRNSDGRLKPGRPVTIVIEP
jgi:WD40 repeat protein